MIIDVHGHFTTAPRALVDYHDALLQAHPGSLPNAPRLTDDQIRESVEPAQVRVQRERGIDLTLLSPRAAGMAHHLGTIRTSIRWARACNDAVAHVCQLYPDRFAGVAQLPQLAGAGVEAAVAELRRCVDELGFVGANVNPDPSGGDWSGPVLSDRYWDPLWRELIDLEVPAMLHVSSSSHPSLLTTADYYIGADTTAFVQVMFSDLFTRFPMLGLVVPHGGGAVPYQWGRLRAIAGSRGYGELDQALSGNVYFDTCVYDQAGIDLLTRVVPATNLLFGSEIYGAARADDPLTGHPFDDTRFYLERSPHLKPDELDLVYGGNALAVYPRLGVR